MAPKKKVTGLIKLQIKAGAANPAPPIGPALGQHGVNIMEFCKAYNAATESQRGNVIPVEITVYEDRSFTFILKTPPAAELIKKAAGVAKGSPTPHTTKVAKLTKAQVREIAEDEAARPERERHRGRLEDHRRHRPFHGHHGRGLRGITTMATKSKAYQAAAAKIAADKFYTPTEAVALAKQTGSAKFDSTVEVALKLAVDPRKADQMVRGTVILPHGTGKTARVIVFATGPAAEAAIAAGADEVGGAELIEKVAAGWTAFDAAVSTPELMGQVGRLGKVLGPRGLMPNPKTGTVTPNPAKAVEEIKGGKIEFRVDKHANVHFVVGKASFSAEQLDENFNAALEEIVRLKPSSSKGRYIQKGCGVDHVRPRHPAGRQRALIHGIAA